MSTLNGKNMKIFFWISIFAAHSITLSHGEDTSLEYDTSFEYGCVIDAGSSGSRIRIYAWKKRSTSLDIPPDVAEVSSLKIRPGIAGFVTDHAGMESHIGSLLAKGKEEIPSSLHSSTPIYLMATAGMRLLLEDNANGLVDSIRDLLEQRSFNPFNFTRQNARILSGEEEGAYAWVSVNYLRGTFTQKGVKPFGILELGGASTQIAFLHDASILADKYPVRLGVRMYNLYVHSFLYYGQDYARRWVREWIVSQNPGQSKYEDPCMLKGYTANDTIHRAYIQIVGSANTTKCEEILEEFVYKTPSRCWPKPCSIGSVYQPTIGSDKEFYALSGFMYGSIAMRVADAENKYSPLNLREATLSFCEMNLTYAMDFADYHDEEIVSTYCLQGLYGHKLFVKGYRIPADDKCITTVKKINDTAPEWALGALLSEMNKRPCRATQEKKDTNGAKKINSSMLIIVTLLLAISSKIH